MTTAELSSEEMEQLRIQVGHLRELEAQRQAVANPPRLQPAPAPDMVNALGGQRPQVEPIQSPLSSQLSPPPSPPPQPVSATTRQPMVQPIQSPLPGLANENSIRQAIVRGLPNQSAPLVDSVRSTLAGKTPAKGLPANLPAPSIETSQDRIPPDIQRVQNYPQQPQAPPPQMPPPVNTNPPQLRPQMTAQDVQNRVSSSLSQPAITPPPSTTPDETMLQDRLRQLMSPPQQPTTALGRGGQMLQYFARYGAMDPAHAQALEIERQKGLAGVRQQQTTDVLSRLRELTQQKNIESEVEWRRSQAKEAARKPDPIPRGAAIPDPDNPGKFIIPSPENPPGPIPHGAAIPDPQHPGQFIIPSPETPTAKNPGFRDRRDEKSGHTFRDYFDETNPSAVTHTADLGLTPSSFGEGETPQQYQDPVTGKWTLGVLNKKTNQITPATVGGQAVSGTAAKLTGPASNRATAAASLEKMIPGLINDIRTHQSEIGPIVGRGENFLLKAGIQNPGLRSLQSGLMSLTPLLLTLHTGNPRSKQLMDEFSQALGRIGEDPANAIAALQRQLDTAHTIKAAQDEALGTGGASAGGGGSNPFVKPGGALEQLLK